MGQQRFVGRVLGTAVLAATLAVAGVGAASAAPTSASTAAGRVAAAEHLVGSAHGRTAGHHALRLSGVTAEDEADSFLTLEPGCAQGKGRARPHAAVVSARKVTLDYTLTGTGKLHRTGKVKVRKDRVTSLGLPKVARGSYRLVLTEHKKTAVVADQRFDVLPCVVVRAGCHAVTFTNPAGNPVADVSYTGHKKRQGFEIELAPGASRTVRADYSRIDYDVYAQDDLDVSEASDPDDAGTVLGSLGRGHVRVKQHCKHAAPRPGDNAVQTVALVGCATSATSTAVVQLSWSSQASLRDRRWSVVGDEQQVVVSGTYKQTSASSVRLPAGAYTYTSRAKGVAAPLESVAFRVLRCVEVVPTCRAVQLTNPNDLPVSAVLVPGDEEDGERRAAARNSAADEPEEDGVVTLPARGSGVVPWTDPTAWVLALPGATFALPVGPFFTVASAGLGDDEPPTYPVPQDC